MTAPLETPAPTGKPYNLGPLHKINLLRPRQIEEMQEQKRYLEGLLQPGRAGALEDASHIRHQLQTVSRDLETRTPPKVSGDVLDKIVGRNRQLLEDMTSGMLGQGEMRRNPAGAVTYNRAWRDHFKEAIQEWKNGELIIQANTGTREDDCANLEKYRPTRDLLATRGSGPEQIPGKLFHFAPYTPQYQDGYDLAFGTPEEQAAAEARIEARDHIIAELRAEIAELRTARAELGGEIPERVQRAEGTEEPEVPHEHAPCGKLTKTRYLSQHVRWCGKAACREARGETIPQAQPDGIGLAAEREGKEAAAQEG